MSSLLRSPSSAFVAATAASWARAASRSSRALRRSASVASTRGRISLRSPDSWSTCRLAVASASLATARSRPTSCERVRQRSAAARFVRPHAAAPAIPPRTAMTTSDFRQESRCRRRCARRACRAATVGPCSPCVSDGPAGAPGSVVPSAGTGASGAGTAPGVGGAPGLGGPPGVGGAPGDVWVGEAAGVGGAAGGAPVVGGAPGDVGGAGPPTFVGSPGDGVTGGTGVGIAAGGGSPTPLERRVGSSVGGGGGGG
jgi:hypothetical protein